LRGQYRICTPGDAFGKIFQAGLTGFVLRNEHFKGMARNLLIAAAMKSSEAQGATVVLLETPSKVTANR
jgi:hypothetical protein